MRGCFTMHAQEKQGFSISPMFPNGIRYRCITLKTAHFSRKPSKTAANPCFFRPVFRRTKNARKNAKMCDFAAVCAILSFGNNRSFAAGRPPFSGLTVGWLEMEIIGRHWCRECATPENPIIRIHEYSPIIPVEPSFYNAYTGKSGNANSTRAPSPIRHQ